MKSPITLFCLLAVVLVTGCSEVPYVPADVTPDPIKMLVIRDNIAVASSSSGESLIELAQPKGFATLQGVFVLDGEPPRNPTLTITKNFDVCRPGGATVRDKIFITGPSGGLANVLVYADGIPDSWVHESMIGNTNTVEFDQKNCLFLKRIFPMQTTQRLKILNSDPVGHNSDMNPGKNLRFNSSIASGGFAMYPQQEGELKEERVPFPVTCGAHPWMKSHMIFRKNGYFSVTGEDGSFELPMLPAGVDLTIKVWHEASRFVPASAVAGYDSSIAQRWTKRGSFTVNLQPDSQTELKVRVSSSALSD